MAPGPTSGEVRTRGWGPYRDALLIVLARSCRERVLRTPSRLWHLSPGSGTRVLFTQRRFSLRVRNQAKRLHGSCTAQGASITSLDRALGDRGERSPQVGECAGLGYGTKLSGCTDLDLPEERAPLPRTRLQSTVRSGLEALPLIRRDMYPDLAVWHWKPSLILERSPGPLGTATSDTRELVTGQRST